MAIHRRTERSPEEKARDRAIREELKDHPTLEELIASGEYSEPIPLGVVLDAMRKRSKRGNEETV